MQEDLYIYQQPFMLQEVKNLDRKKNTTNWYKSVRSARESTWSKLNSPNKLLIFFSSWNGIIFSVSREFDFFLVQLVSKIQLVSVSIDFVPFSKNCRFPETHWGPSLAPYSSCVHLCGFWIEVHWDLPFWPMLFSLGASFSTLPQLTVEQKFKNFKQPEFFVY